MDDQGLGCIRSILPQTTSNLYAKDAMNEWGSIVALSYIAAQRTFPNYNDMADNKAYLESIARSFGYYMGKKRKFELIPFPQSPTMTTAGQGKRLRWIFDLCRENLTTRECNSK